MDHLRTGIEKYWTKLERRQPMAGDLKAAFMALPTQAKSLGQYKDILREGDRPARVCIVQSGLVSRYKTLRNGSRQIMSFHIAGDAVDLQSALVVVADHGIRTHADTIVQTLAHSDVLHLAAQFPELGRALWFDTLVDAAIFREWTVNVGRRNARERTAHLLLELFALHENAGLTEQQSFELTVTQVDLADALSMTPVHLNRVLQWMRGKHLIRTHSRLITIEGRAELTLLSGFNPNYLHMEGPRSDKNTDGHWIDQDECA